MIEETLKRHERIALQFSGGRDSLACVLLLKPYWNRLTIYHVDSGDMFPEARETVDWVKAQVPNFVSVPGRVKETIAAYGYPSDIVPAACTPFGRMLGSGEVALQDRYHCCGKSIMQPMDEAMKRDRITLIIRGQKNVDALKPPLRSGDTSDGFEFLYPIEGWTVARVMEFLKQEGAPIPVFYETMDTAPDCTSCTAWLERGHGRRRFLEQNYPELLPQYQARVRIVLDSVIAHLGPFYREVGNG